MSNLKKSFKKFLAFLLVYSVIFVSIEVSNPGTFEKLDNGMIKIFDQDSNFDSKTYSISYTYPISYTYLVTSEQTIAATTTDSETYNLAFPLSGPRFSMNVTANSLTLTGLSGFASTHSILWLILDENNNQLFWRGNNDDDTLDYRSEVNEDLYNSVGTSYLTKWIYDGASLIDLPSIGTSDAGSESIIRDCEINNYQIPYLSDSGTVEIPGNFNPETEYRIYIALHSDNPATPNCAESLQSSAIFTDIFTEPLSPPDAPTLTSVISGNRQLSISLTSPDYDGGSSITDYEYSTDNGSTWKSAGTTSTSFTITKISSAYTDLVN